ncbi:DUF4432 family protein [Paenibacillus montanisoli]|uniref:DUF4432 domain-containing protein n=1 Tax=Paenibacillus montanisoli TaxID=2081970 RepID=A0A328U5R3_9BACL|nr:DUF4432 family protein [Paenibacillus montanisoli]RAP77899.1 hypothetical protein DL346_05435 [Paenibacillus montanisoli]
MNAIGSDRNYGCRIKTDLIYKGYAAVIMENEVFRLTMLPGKGSDVVELLYKPSDTDFIWFTQLGLRRKEPIFADYQSQYQGGWQEIFPSLSADHNHEGMNMPRYGEAALVEWAYDVVQDDPEAIGVRFSYTCRTMPLRLEKTITMKSGDAGFSISETVTNLSPAPLHADWGHHITFGEPFLQPGTVIELPAEEMPRYVTPAKGSPYEFCWFDTVTEGKYRLLRPDGIGAEVRWDKERWPCLWFWREFGGNKGGPYYGCNYNVGLEMFSSAPAHKLIDNVEKGTAIAFEPYASHHSELHFAVIDQRAI